MPISITTIPAPFRAGLAKVKALSPTDFAAIVTALENAPIAGGLKGLTSAVVQKVPTLKRQEIENILRTVFSLSVIVTDEDTPFSENLSTVSSAMQASGNPNLALSDQEKIEFEKRLGRLLGLNSVTIASKVQRIGLEYPKTFHDAMILTDMRPVFDQPEERPVGCTISHTLRIAYHEGGEHKEFYVVLDANDLQSMKKVLQKAEAKSASVGAVLKLANIPDLS